VSVSPDASRLSEYLDLHKEQLFRFLEELARAESPSRVPGAQGRVQHLMSSALEEIGFRVRLIPGRETGGHLWARPHSRASGAPFQILIGHTDTVWPEGTLHAMPVERDEEAGVLRGPGVFDMKAGLTQMVFALRAIRALGWEPSVTPTLLLNSDEEIGSPESECHIIRLARRASRAIVLEPALGLEGRIKTTRRGAGLFEVQVTGKSSHAGMDPGAGASAILELSYVIQALHGLSDHERGISVNIGEIRGGTRPNVVAAESEASVDVRVATVEDARWVEAQIAAIRSVDRETSVRITGSVDRLPMEATPRNQVLWRAVRGCGRALGLELEQGMSGGGSDGNTASLYTATIDGMGAVGDGAHADHEFLYLDQLVERTALLALTIMLPDSASDPGVGVAGPESRSSSRAS
jgi:glutamate carboxypeptidase